MKLKDKLPQAHILVEVRDQSGHSHRNFAAFETPLQDGYITRAHFSEFLPHHVAALKQRLRREVDDSVVPLEGTSTELFNEEKARMAQEHYDELRHNLQSNPDLVVV